MTAHLPDPGLGEMLVRVTCCALCGSDLHTHAGRRPGPAPSILGHETSGRVAAFGPETPRADSRGTPLAEGDRVAWGVAASCGACFFCRDGLPQKCERLFKYGHERDGPGRALAGGLADFALLRTGTPLFRLPDAVPDALAATAACAGATAAAVLRAAGPAGVVLIFGGGPLGLWAAAMAKAAGATVFVADPDPGRRTRAERFGATGIDPADVSSVRDATAGRGADAVLELAGAPEAVAAAVAAARVGGTVVLAGSVRPTPAVPLDPESVVRRLLTLRGVHNYAPADLAAALDFLAGGGAPFAELLGPSFELGEVNAAFARAHAAPGERVLVVPEGFA